ncbi:hypothetical protein [Kaistia sp. MMO-174]|uniref:hypothetical protein n=1 Tax=Kaistia sp. MMO-174 TaxID=3081256 RepID=UPI0030198EDB
MDIPKLEFRDDITRYVGPFASIKFKANNGPDKRYQPFEIEIWNSGFHASRTLSADEVLAASDWFAARAAEIRAADDVSVVSRLEDAA